MAELPPRLTLAAACLRIYSNVVTVEKYTLDLRSQST